MKHVPLLSILLFLYSSSVVVHGWRGPFRRSRAAKPPVPTPPPPPPPSTITQLRKEALHYVEQRRQELEREWRLLATDVKTIARRKAEQLKEELLTKAHTKQNQITDELERLATQAEQLATERAGQAEAAARDKLAAWETLADQEAVRFKAQAQDASVQAEQAARERLLALEQAATEKVYAFYESLVYGKKKKKRKKNMSLAERFAALPVGGSGGGGGVNAVVLPFLVLLTSLLTLTGSTGLEQAWSGGDGPLFFGHDKIVVPFLRANLSPAAQRGIVVAAGLVQFVWFQLLSSQGSSTSTTTTSALPSVLAILVFGRMCMVSNDNVWVVVTGVITACAVTEFLDSVLLKPKQKQRHLRSNSRSSSATRVFWWK